MPIPASPVPDAHDPEQLGHYRILRLLGVGGMGRVYEAEQESPRRVVALKVIGAGFVSAETQRRFEHEAQVLGRLHHPGIAQIYEAGTAPSPDGPRPFFAMELVRGTALDVYASERGLGRTERLELFAKVCDAVQHAHEQGVIHRDLKPANILVDADGQPKILDFGIARLTDPDLQAVTLHTDVGQVLGTLPYMSPEQAAADPRAIDTRSDVYALGVILYELLCGRRPHELPRALVDAVRMIRESEPTRLSTVDRTLRGDLETIASKALEKDKVRRYASAHELASDLRRHLHDEPIVARPPSPLYQMRKFARRNKALVGGIAAVALALVAGTIVSALQASRARKAEQQAEVRRVAAEEALALAEQREGEARAATERAEKSAIEARTEADKATAVRGFLESMLLAADPSQSGEPDLRVRDLLGPATLEVEQGSLGSQPEVEIAVRRVLARAWSALDDSERAAQVLRPAVTLAEAFDPPRIAELGTLRRALAVAVFGHAPDEAQKLVDAALAAHRVDPGPRSTEVAWDLDVLGMLRYHQDRRAEAEDLTEQSLAILREALGERSPEVGDALATLGFRLVERRDLAAAKPRLDEAIAILEAAPKAETLLASALLQRGRLLRMQDEPILAERDLARSLEIFRRAYGDGHTRVADVLTDLGLLYKGKDKVKAERMLREGLAIRQRVLGDHPDTAYSLTTIAEMLRTRGELAEARALDEEALGIRQRRFGEHHAATADSLRRVAYDLHDEGDLVAAEPLLRRAIDIWDATIGPDHPDLSEPLLELGRNLCMRSRAAEAVPILRRCLALRLKAEGPLHSEVIEARDDLLQALMKDEQWREAETFARETLALYEKEFPPGRPMIPMLRLQLGYAIACQGNFEEGEEMMLVSWEPIGANQALWKSTKALASGWIADMYERWEKPEFAAEWKARAEEYAAAGGPGSVPTK